MQDPVRGLPAIAQLYLLNPIAEAVLLIQRGFWVGERRGRRSAGGDVRLADANFPDDLFARGADHARLLVVFLVFAQLVFSRLENKIPERLVA